MTVTWYSRRPEVSKLAKKATAQHMALLMAIADEFLRTRKDRTQNMYMYGQFLNVIQLLRLHQDGAHIVQLAPDQQTPNDHPTITCCPEARATAFAIISTIGQHPQSKESGPLTPAGEQRS